MPWKVPRGPAGHSFSQQPCHQGQLPPDGGALFQAGWESASALLEKHKTKYPEIEQYIEQVFPSDRSIQMLDDVKDPRRSHYIFKILLTGVEPAYQIAHPGEKDHTNVDSQLVHQSRQKPKHCVRIAEHLGWELFVSRSQDQLAHLLAHPKVDQAKHRLRCPSLHPP